MKEMNTIVSFFEYRCGVYYWLGQLYLTEPSSKLLMEIRDTCKAYKPDTDCPPHEQEFIRFFAGVTKRAVPSLRREITPEYARLFWGPKKVPSPPFESVYVTNTGHLFGESADDAIRCYRQEQLEVQTKDNLPGDFIGYELEFMYCLGYQTLKACERGEEQELVRLIEIQRDFLEKHLLNWIGAFTKDIYDNTELTFFKVLAEFTNEFITGDSMTIGEILEQIAAEEPCCVKV